MCLQMTLLRVGIQESNTNKITEQNKVVHCIIIVLEWLRQGGKEFEVRLV